MAVSGGFAVDQPGHGVSQVLNPGSKMDTPPLDIKRSRRPLRARLARWGAMLVIFMAGGVAGYSVGTARLLQPETPTTGVWNRPERFTEYLLGQLKKDLSLTDAQYPEVEKIIVRHHKAFNDLRLKTQPLFEKEMAQLQSEMQSVLEPAQWTRYKEQLDRMKNRRRGGPPSGGPGRGGPGRDGHRDHGPGGHGERQPHAPSGPSRRPKRPEDSEQSAPKVEPQKIEPAPEKPSDTK